MRQAWKQRGQLGAPQLAALQQLGKQQGTGISKLAHLGTAAGGGGDGRTTEGGGGLADGGGGEAATGPVVPKGSQREAARL